MMLFYDLVPRNHCVTAYPAMAGNGHIEVYWAHAATCVALAQKAVDAESKLALIDMAHAWLALAEQAEKNSQTTVVYEPPPLRLTQ